MECVKRNERWQYCVACEEEKCGQLVGYSQVRKRTRRGRILLKTGSVGRTYFSSKKSLHMKRQLVYKDEKSEIG